uniref:Protease n=1 Tax=Zoothera dauma adenovirus TaxID=3073259 RepID=A0AA51NQ38_9ADEN|nr:protease [Zoothera dauma adenovirus]
MSGTSESELKAIISSMGLQKYFIGTFDCRFPGFIDQRRKQVAIVNTGPRESGGLHWIALCYDNTSFTVFLFDPLGWSELDLERQYGFSYKGMLKRSAMMTPDRCVKLTKNTQAVQCTCSGACGLYCVLFVYCFDKNPSNPFKVPILQDMEGHAARLKPSNPKDMHDNQLKLYNFLYDKSSYFRKNCDSLISNTRVGLIKTH